MQILKTSRGKRKFSYEGSVSQGTTIIYGKSNQPVKIKASQYNALLNHFQGRTVDIGASRTNPPPGSVGEWLQANVTKTATASYVVPVLIHEGYAVKPDKESKIKFNS